MLSESLYLLHSPLLLLLIKMCPFFNPPPPVVKKKLCQWCHRGAVVSQLRSDKDAAMNRPSHWDILEHGVQTDREATANVCCGEVRIKNRFFFLLHSVLLILCAFWQVFQHISMHLGSLNSVLVGLKCSLSSSVEFQIIRSGLGGVQIHVPLKYKCNQRFVHKQSAQTLTVRMHCR